jgi:hypothetical protein
MGIALQADWLRSSLHPSNVWRVVMAKGQMRSNKEKKKPKQDKNKKKGEATSLFKPVSSYAGQYGKKH